MDFDDKTDSVQEFWAAYHQSSKDIAKGHPPIPQDSREWPKEWTTVYYKAYPRLPKIDLDDESLSFNLFSAIQQRKSRRDFSSNPISKRELSLLLKYSCGITGSMDQEQMHRRAQPSGGARFPVETYILLFRGEDIEAGLYHYNVKDHKLDVLLSDKFSPEVIQKYFVYPWIADAACALVLTAVFDRTNVKYGERGYRYAMLEAGHIGQNVYLVSEALGIKCCAMGGTIDNSLEELFDIDGITESVIYGLIVGR